MELCDQKSFQTIKSDTLVFAIMSVLKYLFSFIHWKSRLTFSRGVRVVALEQRSFIFI